MTPNGHRITVSIKLSVDEAAQMDAERGTVPRGTWCRERLAFAPAARDARDRAAAQRAAFDQLSRPYAGMPPTEAAPDSGRLPDDAFPDLRLPPGADYNALDVRGRARW
jgi:hypothetical protein